MSHHKHHMKAKHKRGGGATKGREEYDAQGSNEMKEAKEMKHGGKVHGHKGKHRIHKKRGGGVGSDHSPFTSAAHGGMGDHPAEHGHGHAKGGKDFVSAHGGK